LKTINLKNSFRF
jgi:hypothetical protein